MLTRIDAPRMQTPPRFGSVYGCKISRALSLKHLAESHSSGNADLSTIGPPPSAWRVTSYQCFFENSGIGPAASPTVLFLGYSPDAGINLTATPPFGEGVRNPTGGSFNLSGIVEAFGQEGTAAPVVVASFLGAEVTNSTL